MGPLGGIPKRSDRDFTKLGLKEGDVVTRTRLGVEAHGGDRELDLKAFFEAFDVPWDDTSREVFRKMLERLEERDRSGD